MWMMALTLMGIVIGVIGAAMNSSPVAALGALSAVAGVYLAHRLTNPYVVDVMIDQWSPQKGGDYGFVIPKRLHHKKAPRVQTLDQAGDHYDRCETDVRFGPKGEVTVSVSRPCPLRIVIT